MTFIAERPHQANLVRSGRNRRFPTATLVAMCIAVLAAPAPAQGPRAPEAAGDAAPARPVVLRALNPVRVVSVLEPNATALRQGDVIVKFDDRAARIGVDQAEARVAAARERAGIAQIRLDRQVADHEDALELFKLAAAGRERLRAMLARGLLSEADYRQRLAAIERAQADEAAAGRKLKRARLQNDIAEAAIAEAEAMLADARLILADTELRAPFDCTIVARHVEAGSVVDEFGPVVTIRPAERAAVPVTRAVDGDPKDQRGFTVAGRIAEILVEPGAQAWADNAIVKLDDRRARARHARAEARLAAAEAAREIAELDVEDARADAKLAEAHRDAAAERLKVIESEAESGRRAQEEVDSARMRFILARQAARAAAADLEIAMRSSRVSRLKLDGEAAEWRLAQLNLEAHTMKVDSGVVRVDAIYVVPGAVVDVAQPVVRVTVR
jgi:multidrug resistance efflux pump